MRDAVLVPPKNIQAFGYAVFRRVGIPSSMYRLVVDGLVETSLRGVDSHGIRLIPHYVHAVENGRITKIPRFAFKKTASSTGIVDADNGFGIAAGCYAMDKAVALAKNTGVGVVVVKNSTHYSAAAIFGLRAAREDMIGLSGTDVDSLVFPYGAKETYFGTNPLCFTAPIEGEEPFCVDMASSRVSLNKILAYQQTGKKLERGWAFDRNGNPTVDSNKAVSPMPMGDYKGYGLAAMISILSSVLSGMPFGPSIHPMYPLDNKRRKLGHFFIAIDISKFRPITAFKRDMKKMVRELRALKPANPALPVLVSGDPEKQQFVKRTKSGIPVSRHDILVFQQLASSLQLNSDRFFHP